MTPSPPAGYRQQLTPLLQRRAPKRFSRTRTDRKERVADMWVMTKMCAKKKRCRYWFLFWRKDLIALPFVPPRFVASPFPNHLMVTTLVLTRNQQPEWNHASNDRLTPHLALQHLPIGFTIPTSRGLGTAFPTMSRSRGDLMWQCGDWWAQPKLEPQAKIPTSLF